MNEILTQVTVPYAYFAMVLNLQPGRHRATYELMSAVFRLSTIIVMQFKHHFRIRRPADRSSLIQPVLLTPGHGSYPAGHATQCHFMAAVLKKLTNATASSEVADQLDKLATRIAENRVVAGLHYPEDNDVGELLGKQLAEHFIFRATDAGSAVEWVWGKAKAEW